MTSLAQPAISVRALVKQYAKSKTRAVDGVSFDVAPGEIFGLLGPNGAGKTTIIGVLTTAIVPTEGEASVMGVDVARDPIAVKKHIAVVPQQSNLDRSLKVREILTFHAAYHGIARKEREARADNLLAELGLAERKNEKVNRYSGGMAQRLMIARALMHSPNVLFLDEPTNNLDPQSRLFLWERIQEMNAKGLTILLTTHDMEEADKLCGRIAIMDHGKILVNDTPAELKKLIPGGTALEVRAYAMDGAAPRLADALAAIPGVTKVDRMARPRAHCSDLPRLRRCGQHLDRPRRASRARQRSGSARSQHEATLARRSLYLSHWETPALMNTRLALKAFLAILERDFVVTCREFVPFLLQALMQPLFFLFIFGKVLPGIGLAAPNFSVLMLPGIVALTGMIAAMQGVTLPLVLDLGFAREIDDRLLSPLPVWWVALEKVIFGAVRGAIASSVIFPLGWLILGSGFHVRADRIPVLIGMVILTGCRRLHHRSADGHGNQARANQPDVHVDLHAAAIHRLHLLSMGRAEQDPLVPGIYFAEPADVCVGRVTLLDGAFYAGSRFPHNQPAVDSAGLGDFRSGHFHGRQKQLPQARGDLAR